MKAGRCNFEPTEVRLSFLMLAFWSPALSIILIFYVLSVICAPPREARLNLKLHPAGSAERLPNRSKSPEIFIQEGGAVYFNNSAVDSNTDKRLPGLRRLVLAHMRSSDAAATVVFVEDQATFERVIDVMNVFEACDYTSYRFVFLTEPMVGPRLPRNDDPTNALPSPMQEYLRSLRSGL